MSAERTIARRWCPVCGSMRAAGGQRETRGTGPGYWRRCADCGLLWEERVRKEWPNEKYEADGGTIPAGATYDANEPKIARARAGGAVVAQWRASYDWMAARIKPWVQRGGVLLDIGFGGGEWMDYAKERKEWSRVAGIELGRDFVLAARARGHEAHYLDVATRAPVAGLEGACHLVLAVEIMEHVVDPAAFVRGAARYLAPTGVLWATFARAAGCDELHNGEWQYWTVGAAARLVERAGMDVVFCEATRWTINVLAQRAHHVPAYAEREVPHAAP